MEHKAAIHSFVSDDVRKSLREIAEKNKRSLSQQIAWVLERYVKSEQEDGA